MTGPDFPPEGVKYVPAVRDLKWYWVDPALPQMPNPGFQMQGNCIGLIDEAKEAAIKAIPDNASYVFKAVNRWNTTGSTWSTRCACPVGR